MSHTLDKRHELEALRKIKSHEERDLRRVFNKLSGFHEARKMAREVAQVGIFSGYSSSQSSERVHQKKHEKLARGKDNLALQRKRTERFKELQELTVESTVGKKITALDLSEMLRYLGRPSNKRYIWDMIWEVDEKLNGFIDYEDFKLCFQRNISDKTGLEPSKFFNLVMFLSFDKSENKECSVDETMAFLHARYGRQGLELKLKELFGADMVESGPEGGEIDFLTYLSAVDKAQRNMYEHSEVGQAELAKVGLKATEQPVVFPT